MDNGYKKYMMLKIRRVNKSDFGSYKCVAKNSLGETDGVIKLEGRTPSKIDGFPCKTKKNQSSDFRNSGADNTENNHSIPVIAHKKER
jgi:hypothetical protein